MNGTKNPNRRRRSSSESREGSSQWILTSFNAFDKKLDEIKVDQRSIRDDVDIIKEKVRKIESQIDRVKTAAWAVGITLTIVISIIAFLVSFIELPTYTLSIIPVGG